MNDTSRRSILAVATVGSVAALAAGSAAAEAPQPSGPSGELQDPRSKFPRPPFPEQTQTWPGLASQMNPRPDHGESSYVGSGRLAGRKALMPMQAA